MKKRILLSYVAGFLTAAALFGFCTPAFKPDSATQESIDLGQEDAGLEVQPETDSTQPSSSDSDDVEDLSKMFCILATSTSEPNSANGVDLSISFWSSQPIKYLTVWTTPYNGVNDPVLCEITRQAQQSCRYTGPSSIDYPVVASVENEWYNATIKYAVLDKIRVEFMDGSIYETENVSSLLIGNCFFDQQGVCVDTAALNLSVSNILKESGMTEDDFIASYASKYPDQTNYAAELFDDETIFRSMYINVVINSFAEVLGIDALELLYSL